MNSPITCHSSRPRSPAGLLTVVFLGLSGCGLFSIEPDEIDIADDEVGTDDDVGTDDEAGGSETAATGDAQDSTDSLSDGTDDTSGDGDGDTDTSEVSTETSDPLLCEARDEVVVGPNDVSVATLVSDFQGSCGGTEGESIYSFTADSAGDYEMALEGPGFSAVLYILGADCVVQTEPCSTAEDSIVVGLAAGETILVVVDSDGGMGDAVLVITGP